MNMHSITMVALPLAVTISLFGCAKDPVKNLSDRDSRIYITNRDSTIDFSGFKSFHVSDSVAIVNDGELEMKSATTADIALIAAIRQVMVQRGYTEVSKEENPDLGINVSQVVNSYTGVISYPSYWGYYGTYWDPYYWGYGGYDYFFPYASYALYKIQQDALVIDMVDLKDANESKQIKGVWNGVVRGAGLFDATNAESQVRALFDQSTYILANN